MKIKVVIGLIFISLLTGCELDHDNLTDNKGVTHYFKIISDERKGFIVYDTRTGVEYWLSHVPYNQGSLTVLVDKTGKPLIYEVEVKE